MAGYYDEITGEYIDDGSDYGYDILDNTSGTNEMPTYEEDYYGYGDYDWSVSDLPDYTEVGGDIWDSLKSIATRYGPQIFSAAKRMVTNDKG